jgi:TatD-related deoxyribonuclease
MKENLQSAAQRGDLFLMETDYLDDMNRPGAVLGIKTVPKRTKWLIEMGYLESMKNAHVETPKIVYGIDTNEN